MSTSTLDMAAMKQVDPMAALQYEIFEQSLRDYTEKNIRADRIGAVVDFFCEQSRALLSRRFGQMYDGESALMTDLFRRTAEQIRYWMLVIEDSEQRDSLVATADHIQQRTRMFQAL